MKTTFRLTMTAVAMVLVMISTTFAQEQGSDPTNIPPGNSPELTNGEKPLLQKPNFGQKTRSRGKGVRHGLGVPSKRDHVLRKRNKRAE